MDQMIHKQPLITKQQLVRIDEYIYEIPMSYRADMRVPARVFIHEAMLDDVLSDRALWQLVNVATLPGIQKFAFAMPDIHQGYGFPIGGVAASAINQGGVISPGGIGYDINCGVRLLAATISASDLRPHLNKVATKLFHAVPSGVGRGGKLTVSPDVMDAILYDGAHHMVKLGYGTERDLDRCEEQGRMAYADPSAVTVKAKSRGRDQLGTLGSGNHFLEVQEVDEIFDPIAAAAFGLKQGGVTIMIHCGSRGLGHQTCTDHVRIMMHKLPTWGYQLPDRELVYAPIDSVEGSNYFAAMAAASNYAWANRHLIGHWTRQAWRAVLGSDATLETVYDVSHNIGKKETHLIDEVPTTVIMHRKGATRAFGPGRPEVPAAYRDVGQPVLIPGTMGTASYVLAGATPSMHTAFGSCCHGAGRRLSRAAAKKDVVGAQLRHELEKRGIAIRSDSDIGLAEEAPTAYKDVEQVVQVVHGAHLAHKVARLKPLAVIKGG